jgi:hypothetical protein
MFATSTFDVAAFSGEEWQARPQKIPFFDRAIQRVEKLKWVGRRRSHTLTSSHSVGIRVASWYIFRPKIAIWVNF